MRAVAGRAVLTPPPDAPVFAIGLRPIPAERWLEGGEVDAARKRALRADHPAQVWGATTGSEAGQAEAAGLVAGWLSVEPPTGREALWRASLGIADDLCLMERVDGAWTLTAASLCSPSFFTAAEVLGKPLNALHAPVPGFGARLLPRVARIFDHLADGVILERRNWSVVSSGELFLPSAEPVRATAAELDDAALARALVVRRERQTVRRLPRTGGVLFTIRVHREPLAEMIAEPSRRAAFAESWARTLSSEGDDFRAYKGLASLDRAVRRLLAG